MAGVAVTRPAPVPLAPLLLAVAVALPLAVSMPLGLAVYGFMLLGVAHNLAELRYVFGRYVFGGQGLGRLERGALLLIVLPLLAVIGARAANGTWLSPEAARQLEVGLVYGTLLGVLMFGRGQRALRGALAVLVGLGLWASLSWLKWHFLVLSHLHNLMPVVFLLLHSREGRGRALLGALVWAVAVPAAILGGVFDSWLPTTGFGHLGPLDQPDRMANTWLWQGVSPTEALRVVATFSFLQGMHYAIWIGILPRISAAPELSAAPRWARALYSPWAVTGALALTVGMIPFYLDDYLGAFSAYAALASFHALVEFPLLLAWVLGEGKLRSATGDAPARSLAR